MAQRTIQIFHSSRLKSYDDIIAHTFGDFQISRQNPSKKMFGLLRGKGVKKMSQNI
jgi:hypothetical protein